MFLVAYVCALVACLSLLCINALIGYRLSIGEYVGQWVLTFARTLTSMCSSSFYLPIANILFRSLRCEGSGAMWCGTHYACGSSLQARAINHPLVF